MKIRMLGKEMIESQKELSLSEDDDQLREINCLVKDCARAQFIKDYKWIMQSMASFQAITPDAT